MTKMHWLKYSQKLKKKMHKKGVYLTLAVICYLKNDKNSKRQDKISTVLKIIIWKTRNTKA